MKIIVPLSLLLLAFGAHTARVRLIRSWLRPGPLRPVQRAALASPAPGALRPVRVLLVDGLAADIADRLPAHGRLCAEGLRLTVEVGFPTVSLPVQHVLWTGAWQAQSGVAFAVGRLPRRLLPSLPELVAPRSAGVAVAESHREVVSSFPFARVVAPPARGRPLPPAELRRLAIAEARSPAALVLVHTLAVDEAGHRGGFLSARYLEAARRSDELLADLMAERRPEWTLLALSDHGHTAAGGHGDLEVEVSEVRACLVGSGLPAGRSLRVGLPDLTAILAEQLGVPPPAACVGHGLAALLDGGPRARAPAAGPRGSELLFALLALAAPLAAVLALRGRLPRPRRRSWLLLLPWSTALAALLLAALGPPSLSWRSVYPSLSPLLLWVGLAAGLLIALQARTAARLDAASMVTLPLAAGAIGPALAVLFLGGWPLRSPPLVPFWSGWSSCLLEVAALQLLALACCLAISAAASAGRR